MHLIHCMCVAPCPCLLKVSCGWLQIKFLALFGKLNKFHHNLQLLRMILLSRRSILAGLLGFLLLLLVRVYLFTKKVCAQVLVSLWLISQLELLGFVTVADPRLTVLTDPELHMKATNYVHKALQNLWALDKELEVTVFPTKAHLKKINLPRLKLWVEPPDCATFQRYNAQ